MTYITKDQFFQWNPALNSQCNGLWVGYYYCVASFGSSRPMPTVTVRPTPVAVGSSGSCKSWYNTTVGDTCGRIALQFGSFQASDFMNWNPSVGSDCGGRKYSGTIRSFWNKPWADYPYSLVEMGLYYCVAIDGTPSTRTAPFSATTTAPSSTSLPKGCADTWFVGVDDTCQSITDYKNIPLASFIKWNPQLNAHNSTDCQVAPNTYVCVGSSDGATTTDLFSSTATGTATSSTSSTRTTSSSTTTRVAVSTPAPTQAGMVQGCKSTARLLLEKLITWLMCTTQ